MQHVILKAPQAKIIISPFDSTHE